MIHKTFSINGSPDIEVRIESGRVEVRKGEAGSVDVDVDVDTKLTDFVVEQRGNSVLVASNRDGGWLSRGPAYVVIATPPGSDLTVSVASANVDVGVDLRKVEIKTASGDINLERAESAIIKTASGDVRIAETVEALRYTSASGDLVVEDCCRGSVGISTASGDVRIEQCDATINLNTASGDARIGRFTGRSANFKSMSGNIDLGVPARSTVDLDVKTLSGKVGLPDPEPRRDQPERHIDIKAKLVSGDFRIDRA